MVRDSVGFTYPTALCPAILRQRIELAPGSFVARVDGDVDLPQEDVRDSSHEWVTVHQCQTPVAAHTGEFEDFHTAMITNWPTVSWRGPEAEMFYVLKPVYPMDSDLLSPDESA